MKSITSLLLSFTLALSATAAEPPAAGPKGGRLLATTPNATEFHVTDERRVEITFYDAALQPAAPGDRVVAITAEPASGRTPIELERTATGFVSTGALPEASQPYRVVVQVRETAAAKPQNFRIDLNLEPCAECRRAEYACVCESH